MTLSLTLLRLAAHSTVVVVVVAVVSEASEPLGEGELVIVVVVE